MNEAQKFLDDVSKGAEHLSDKLLFGCVTACGTLTLSTSKNMDLVTLIQLRKMIGDHIKDLKESNATYMHEL